MAHFFCYEKGAHGRWSPALYGAKPAALGRHDADRRTGLVQLDATDYLSTGEPQPLHNLAARYPLERKEP